MGCWRKVLPRRRSARPTISRTSTAIGRYPVPSSPPSSKPTDTPAAFLKAAKYFDRPRQLFEIPFEGKKIVAYLQVPRGVARPPVAMYWGGVDVWKEDHQRNSEIMHARGLATVLVDQPGTGESPVRFAEPNAARQFSAVMDHLATRKDVDGARVGVWGRSFGAIGPPSSPMSSRSVSRVRCSMVATLTTVFRKSGCARR